MKTDKTLADKIADANMRASYWLAEGNKFAERGQHERAEKCYSKSQFWLDRYTKLCRDN